MVGDFSFSDSGLGFFKSKVSGSHIVKTLKFRSKILKPGSRSLPKSQSYHSIPFLLHGFSFTLDILR